MAHVFYHSPLGWLKISSQGKSIQSIEFLDQETKPGSDSKTIPAVLKQCVKEFNAYFEGALEEFTVAVAEPGSDFQRQVMREVRTVGYGQVATYLDIAHKVGDRKAVRAVGGANGRNQIPIIIPCHRIIATSGELSGYAWGLWRKKWLLEFEQGQKQLDLFN